MLSQTACTIESTSLFSDDSDSDAEFECVANPNIKVRTVSFAREHTEKPNEAAGLKKSAKDVNCAPQAGSSILGMLKKRAVKPPQAAPLNQDEEPIC